MEEKEVRFHPPSLMRISELNIRDIAAKDYSITLEEYLHLLCEATDKIPACLSVLSKLAQNDTDDLTLLSDAKDALERIGCYSFVSLLDGVVSGKLTVDEIVKLANNLGGFFRRISNTKNIPKSLVGDFADGEYDNIYKSKLGYAINQLDREEATRKMRVLAVDDAAVILNRVSAVLSDMYKVHTIANPMMVEKYLDYVVPELFLLDYKMPLISGFELIPIIRRHEEHKNTPIIFLTAAGTIENISTAMSLGACDFIVKPFQTDVLQNKVAEHIERKRLF